MAEKNLKVKSGFRKSRTKIKSKNQHASRHVKELTKPINGGALKDSISLRSAKAMRRRAHKIERNAMRRAIDKARRLIDETIDAIEDLYATARRDKDHDWMPLRAKKCGSVTVSAYHIKFHRKK